VRGVRVDNAAAIGIAAAGLAIALHGFVDRLSLRSQLHPVR
jgi:hypothetical protein